MLSAFFRAKDTILSEPHMNSAPSRKPVVATTYAGKVEAVSARSIAGCNRDQKLAAIITPEAKPSMRFRAF